MSLKISEKENFLEKPLEFIFFLREIETEATDIEKALLKLPQVRSFSVNFRSPDKFPAAYISIYKRLVENISFAEESYKLGIFSLFSEDTEPSSWKKFLNNEMMMMPRILARDDVIILNNQIRLIIKN